MAIKVLVTGATGLIGRRVVEQLVSRGHQVIGLDRRLDSRLRIVPEPVRREVSWIEGDTRDLDKLQSAVRHVDAVVHLAAGASFLMYEEAPLEHTAGTIQGFHNLLEVAKQRGIGKIVYASTSAVYEGNELPYRESMALRPPDLKAFAKKVNEEMAEIYINRYQMQLLALRPFSVYGEDEMSKGKYANVVSLFAWAMSAGQRPIVWGDGYQTRDFIHVSDVGRAFAIALESDAAVRALNVGTGIETSFIGLIKLLAAKLSVEVDPIYVPTPISIYAKRLLADVSLCVETIDFQAEVTLEQGVEKVLDRALNTIKSQEFSDLAVAQEVVLKEKADRSR